MNNEPALILTLLTAILNLVVGFGLDLSVEQITLINAVASGVVGLFIRQQVSPASSTLLRRGKAEGQKSVAWARARQQSQ